MAKKENIREIARRYTTAVLELAKSGNSLDEVRQELQEVLAAVSEAETAKSLRSPLLSATRQLEIVRELGKKVKASSITTNFLLIIAKNRRLGSLPQIIEYFLERIAEEKGEIKAEVRTAQKLEAAQIAEIETALGKKTGKKVIVAEKVEPALIGGLAVKIGSKLYDYSIKSRLSKIKNQMKSAS